MEENRNPVVEVEETEKELNSGVEENLAEKGNAVETEEKNESMEGESANSGKKGGRGMVSTRNGLYLRTVIGGLILYYAYTIVSDMGNASGTSRTMLYVFVAVFGIAGIWIILDSLKRLFKKEYDE